MEIADWRKSGKMNYNLPFSRVDILLNDNFMWHIELLKWAVKNFQNNISIIFESLKIIITFGHGFQRS